ncbi:MAG TPA: GldG family protein, partial [Burkholderiales bacterium]
MTHSSRSGLILLAGVVLLIATGVANAVFIDARLAVYLLGIGGIVLCAWGAYGSRAGIGELVRQRRGEVALYTIGLVGILILMAWLSARFPVRFDMTENRQFSLSPATEAMLDRLEKPVHVVFFNDRMMRETTEIYEQMARRTDKLTVEFFDPMLNPAQARMRGVEFAGTAIFESEGRKLTVNGPTETDIANGILRISQGVQQTVCFLDGHGEPDPFSLESHDHTESNAGHSHGLGSKLVLHERHGIAKARHGLEAMNYVVQRASLLQGVNDLAKCSVLVVAGPKIPLLPAEVKAIDKYLVDGGNALFMLDPFIKTGNFATQEWKGSRLVLAAGFWVLDVGPEGA